MHPARKNISSVLDMLFAIYMVGLTLINGSYIIKNGIYIRRDSMKKRIWGLDAVRDLAVALVLSIHGITLSNLVANTFGTSLWYPVLLLRQTALACVPLFILLTGYLNKDKRPCKKYYLSVIPVLITYLVISVLSQGAKIAIGEGSTVIKNILHVFDFTANGYAWYMEMYLGLFIMAPFINIFYSALGTLKNRITVTAVLAAVTMLPSAFSSLGVADFRLDILPGYWESMYPVTYYFIGMLLADTKPEIKKGKNIAVLAGWIIVMAAACFGFSALSGQYAWWFANGFGCIYNAVTAVLIFMLLYNINCRNGIFKNAVSFVSSCTLEIYLLSYITDKALYTYFHLPMPVMTALTFLCSLGLAVLLKKVLLPISGFIMYKAEDFLLNIESKK